MDEKHDFSRIPKPKVLAYFHLQLDLADLLIPLFYVLFSVSVQELQLLRHTKRSILKL